MGNVDFEKQNQNTNIKIYLSVSWTCVQSVTLLTKYPIQPVLHENLRVTLDFCDPWSNLCLKGQRLFCLLFPFHKSINISPVVFPHFFGQELWGAIQISIIDGRWNAESVRELFLFRKFLVRTPIHRGRAHGKIFFRVKMWKHNFVKMWKLVCVKMWKLMNNSTVTSLYNF